MEIVAKKCQGQEQDERGEERRYMTAVIAAAWAAGISSTSLLSPFVGSSTPSLDSG